jgi:hypothetical protein
MARRATLASPWLASMKGRCLEQATRDVSTVVPEMVPRQLLQQNVA